jgi:hypothetical protein
VTEKETSRKMLARLKKSNLLMTPMALSIGKGRKSKVLLVDKCMLDLVLGVSGV